MQEQQIWLIPALPLAAAALQALVGRRLGRVGGPLLGIVAMAGAFLLTASGLRALLAGAPAAHVSAGWLRLDGLDIPLGLEFGRLQAAVLTMVTFASTLIQTYSIGYMHGDARYHRFFTLVSLFTFGMILTVMADNLLFLLVGWEVMGLCSYLLIGHWFENPDNVRAAMKAFVTTRIGDLGLFGAIYLLWAQTGTISVAGVAEAVEAVAHGGAVPAWVTWAALLLFLAAVGKSAQLPLHVWLPDAMAGPTPVSALIHAATMVAAGVYLVARHFFLFEASPTALATVAWVGGLTALFAATIAVVQEDIKRVLAYSTMSQLGYMMLGLGAGAFAAGIFHLITHGFFKALLFLGAGSVIHALHHEQNLHKMGGLLAKMPLTAATFLVGTLALAGVWPFSGFFSKDEILLAAWEARPALFWLALAGAALTAFYMTRAFVLAFLGRPRDRERFAHAHESPAVMTVPLLLLSIPSLLAGLPAAQRLIGPAVFGEHFGHAVEHHGVASPVPALATGAALLGIVLGLVLYARPGAAALRRRLVDAAYPLYALLKNRYYVDELYEATVVRATRALAAFAGTFDRAVVDGLVHGVAGLAVALGGLTRRAATGLVQGYMIAMFVGVILGLLILQAVGG